MKNKLQYAYSILVMIGVLVTAYLMINKPADISYTERIITSPSYKASYSDPALSQLFEMENVLSKAKESKKPSTLIINPKQRP